MFTISVCMIIKDEEDCLSRILTCAKKFADEIIIVDTGSTDDSVAIAKKFTDKVYQIEWPNDFAKARNISFSYASSDYIMWLDADDIVTDSNIDKILSLKESEPIVDVYMCKYVMGFKNNKPTFEFFRERLLKRANNYQWSGFVHEAIAPSGKIEYTDIEIEHRKTKIGNPKRNLQLYENALNQGINFSPREQYYYSRELYYNAQFDSAINNLIKYLSMKDRYTPNVIGAHLLLAECYLYNNNPKFAKDTIFECIKLYLPNSEICCMIGNIFDKEKDLEQAIYWYQSALTCPKHTSGFVNIEYQNIIPYISLCRLNHLLGKVDTAKKYHLLAKKINPEHPSVKYNDKFF